MKIIVLSPDGFPIERDKTYKSLEQANDALDNWVTRYQSQGYYSTMNREQISLSEIKEYCTIQKL